MKPLGNKGHVFNSNQGHFIGKGLPWKDTKINQITITLKASDEYLVVFPDVSKLTKQNIASFGQPGFLGDYGESPYVFLLEDDYSLSIAKHLLDSNNETIGIHKIRVIDKQCIESIVIVSDYLFMIEEHKKMLQAKTEMENNREKKVKPKTKSNG